MNETLACRGCGSPLQGPFLSLGNQPLANSYVPPEAATQNEHAAPLDVFHCTACHLVQIGEVTPPETIFVDYAYLSSVSSTWRRHLEAYADQVTALNAHAPLFVVEAASNDGYLLGALAERGHRVLGVEPAQNIARQAQERGIPTEAMFFTERSARTLRARHGPADLLVANNVLAHVPDPHDFIAGVTALLAPKGTASFEFPHLVRLLQGNQFDTIYHEHYSYLSLTALTPVFDRHGLAPWRIDTLPTHGGSLRVWVAPQSAARTPLPSVAQILELEERAGIRDAATYVAFAERAQESMLALRDALRAWNVEGRRVAAYGAPAKGNTLLNSAGIGNELIAYTVDRNPGKQGRLLPGSRIPVHAPEHMLADRPDEVLILPWNIQDEIRAELQPLEASGARLHVPIPRLHCITPEATAR